MIYSSKTIFITVNSLIPGNVSTKNAHTHELYEIVSMFLFQHGLTVRCTGSENIQTYIHIHLHTHAYTNTTSLLSHTYTCIHIYTQHLIHKLIHVGTHTHVNTTHHDILPSVHTYTHTTSFTISHTHTHTTSLTMTHIHTR